MRKEISQFSLNPLSSRSSLSRTITRNSKLQESAKFKSQVKSPNYIKLAPIYTLSILGSWDLDELLIWWRNDLNWIFNLNFWPKMLLQEAALPLWRAGQKIGAWWCVRGASWCGLGAPDATLPAPRAGQEKLVRQKLPWCAVGAARIKNWCARNCLGA